MDRYYIFVLLQIRKDDWETLKKKILSMCADDEKEFYSRIEYAFSQARDDLG